MTDEQSVLSSIRGAPENGLAMRELVVFHPEVSRRTLQRLVNDLIAAGEIESLGAGAGRRYVAKSRREKAPDTGAIRLSPEAIEIRQYVRGPILSRRPVGYRRDFLAEYEPGQTFYLGKPLRERLRRLGATGAEELPAGTYGRGILDRLLI